MVRRLLMVAMQGDRHWVEAGQTLLHTDAELVRNQAERLLTEQVDAIWRRGWQPAEVVRQGRRGTETAAAGRLVAWAVAADHVTRTTDSLDPRWIDQVDALDLPDPGGVGGWVGRWSAAEAIGGREELVAVVGALAVLAAAPQLESILPPPDSSEARRTAGTGGGHAPRTGSASDPVLERIRALLAKAESTTFEAEATAFTAKAQELMTRHAIDAATVQAATGAPDGEQPIMIRLPVDPPYADAKALLLQVVAEAGRCRAVRQGNLDLSTVVGFAADVAAVELLFTSLLLQAQTALADASRHAPPGTRVRSQRYRSAFLLAYAGRIGERLTEINQVVVDEATAAQGDAFLPVLASRADAVDDYLADTFGTLSTSRVRGGYDPAGWAGGTVAADNARLNAGHLTPTQ